jgi:zinc/manganese transport system ATP-binding protein
MLCYNITHEAQGTRRGKEFSSRHGGVFAACSGMLGGWRSVADGVVGNPMKPAIGAVALEDLTVAYDRVPAIHHLTGIFAPGSLTAIVGPNGAGKSTLLKAIVGILAADDGRVSLGVRNHKEIAYLPQQAEIDRNFPITVRDTVGLGLWQEIGIFGSIGAGERQRIYRALAIAGIEGLARRPVGTLSAGQFQRVLFARLLVQDARVILLDEPFAALDERTTGDLMQLLADWHREHRTVIAVLHDIRQIRAHFPDVLLIAREPVAWGPAAEVLTADNLARARALSQLWIESGHHHAHAHARH